LIGFARAREWERKSSVEPADGARDRLDAHARAVRTACETLTDPEVLRTVVRALIDSALDDRRGDAPLAGVGG
jgi:hypothetical protein